MKWTRPGARFRGFRTLYVQVHDNRFLAAANDHGFHRLIRSSVHLLMRDERWHVNKIARSGFIDELQVITPAEACAPANDIEDGLQLSVMMRPGARGGLYDHRSGPELIRSRTRVCDRRGAGHPGSLGSIRIQFSRPDDANSIFHFFAALALASCSALIKVSRCLESFSFSVQMYSQRSLSVIRGVHCVTFQGRV
jgi:hypothetical protein